MRERYDMVNFKDFQEHEILEMLLFYVIPQRNTNDIAHILIKKFHTVKGVLNAPPEELERIGHIGPAAVRYIKLWANVFERVKKSETELPQKLTPRNAEQYFAHLFEGKKREEVYMICLDPQDNILACEKISEGSFETAEIDPANAARIAISYDSAQVVFAHNHPSGISDASEADITVTKLLEGAFFIMGIRLRDHIIFTENKCVSIMNEYHIRRSGGGRAKRR